MSVATRDLVSNALLREEFIRREQMGWISSHMVALRLGWILPDGRSDVSRVLRVLGMTVSNNKGRTYKRRRVTYELAARLARAMNLDPVDIDL